MPGDVGRSPIGQVEDVRRSLSDRFSLPTSAGCKGSPFVSQPGYPAAMPRVTFTGNLQRLVAAPPATVQARTVREALEAAFASSPRLRGYLLDDQGALRKHVVVFVGGEAVKDRVHLSDEVSQEAEIAVLQALSGG